MVAEGINARNRSRTDPDPSLPEHAADCCVAGHLRVPSADPPLFQPCRAVRHVRRIHRRAGQFGESRETARSLGAPGFGSIRRPSLPVAPGVGGRGAARAHRLSGSEETPLLSCCLQGEVVARRRRMTRQKMSRARRGTMNSAIGSWTRNVRGPIPFASRDAFTQAAACFLVSCWTARAILTRTPVRISSAGVGREPRLQHFRAMLRACRRS